MDSEDTNTVITIADEPAAKRSREANEVTENVSISSDSVHSVEMTSDSDDESIIESVELPLREPNVDDDDVVIFEPVIEQDVNSRDSGIHNEPTQVGTTREPQADVPDEPTIASIDTLEPTQDLNDLAIHYEPTQVYPIVNVEVDENEEVIATENTDDAEVEK